MVTIKRLIDGAQVGTGLATYYTAPENTRTKITLVTVTNTSGTARTLTLHLVVSGGTASNTNMVVSARTVGAGQTLILPEAAHVLESGDSIQALASAGSAITLMASGAEVT